MNREWTRRTTVATLGGLAALPARAQPAYPNRPVRIVVPFPPGGTSDILARLAAEQLAAETGQPFVVDNRAGGAANIGAELVAKAAPDGYTLLLISTIHFINAGLFEGRLAYDVLRDFAPIGLIAAVSQVVLVNPALPVTTLQELIAYARARPGMLNYSSPGSGSQPHLTAELFATATGTRMVHVPYRGAPQALTDVVNGQVQLTFATSPSAVPLVRGGQVRALAVTSAERLPALPEVPTTAEAGMPGFESAGGNGLAAPAGTPPAIVERLSVILIRMLGKPDVRRALAEQAAAPRPMSPAEFTGYIAAEVMRWREAVRLSGAKPE
ncbi:tripartite tricarboxylate transporter substrate binding protein [Roseomonas indoligenes]|uniref:Tripartite tricarboxylate transporter substrate binding protein n=1 Tax=Roseomonas indoligenes TaxID=2820811 RepID=A0A940N0L3_9PROT|nr:tripartite tricarboxylate transporter substrate binding protein [Pararoseomonas indoligenes]MBP0495681.1 tripartite tricarboxylate transporter substrate binding protein [Pararoseomonas indoligenes]